MNNSLKQLMASGMMVALLAAGAFMGTTLATTQTAQAQTVGGAVEQEVKGLIPNIVNGVSNWGQKKVKKWSDNRKDKKNKGNNNAKGEECNNPYCPKDGTCNNPDCPAGNGNDNNPYNTGLWGIIDGQVGGYSFQNSPYNNLGGSLYVPGSAGSLGAAVDTEAPDEGGGSTCEDPNCHAPHGGGN
jgi:hypothetical protein